MARISKKAFFAQYGVVMDKDDHVLAPWGEWVPLPLVKGSKTWTLGWSTLAGTKEYTVTVNGEECTMCGTCSHNCEHCYAQCGRYAHRNVQDALAWRTLCAREHSEWLGNVIKAQLMWGHDWECEIELVERFGKKGQPLKPQVVKHWSRKPEELCRVHVSGDFFEREVSMWKEIILHCNRTDFWAYTKEECAAPLVGLPNFNLVESILPTGHFNFGTISEILMAREYLINHGIQTHICLCALDADPERPEELHTHCVNCTACSQLGYVLFLKHGDPDYDPLEDPLWDKLVQILMEQPSMKRN